MIREMIEEMILLKRTDSSGNDLLTELINARDLETGAHMDDRQLTDEVLTFFLAGHETTAVTAFWTMWLLESNPQAKEQLQAELKDITLDNLDLEKLHQLTYTEAVIKESMRLYSPVWVLGREALSGDKIGEFDIKKGDSIIFSPFMVQRHEKYWSQPEEFVPERFLTETPFIKNTYFPFGSGPLLCIGNNFAMLELKVILIALIAHVDLKFDDGTFPGFDCSLTLRPSEDKRVSIT